MMKYIFLLWCFLFCVALGWAQPGHLPNESNRIDSLLGRMELLNAASGNEARQKETGQLLQHQLASISTEYPQYAGVMYLYLARYAFAASERVRYINTAIGLIHKQPKDLLVHFVYNLRWLLTAFGDENRITEWDRADSMIRASIKADTLAGFNTTGLPAYAMKLSEEGNFALARDMLAYDIIYTAGYHSPENIEDRLKVNFCQVIYFNAELLQFLQMPYSKRTNMDLPVAPGENFHVFISDDVAFFEKMKDRDFNMDFIRLSDTMNVLNNELNSAAGLHERYDRFYHGLYVKLLLNFSDWASRERYPGKAILPLKIYLMGELLPAVRKYAATGGPYAILTAKDFQAIFTSLSQLYLNIGNYKAALKFSEMGIQFFKNDSGYTGTEKEDAVNALLIASLRAARAGGNTAKTFELLEKAEGIYRCPDSVTTGNINTLLNYSRVKLEKIYTYLGKKDRRKAFTILGELYDSFDAVKGMDEKVLNTSDVWPDLLYLGAEYQAGKGNWNNIFIDQAVVQLFEHHETHTDKMYDALLLMFNIRWHNKMHTAVDILPHLFLYTERQLKYNFILLNAEERMQFYDHSLSKIFGLYHELLFSGYLDSLPQFKERVIAQTLFLKSAMGEGNVYPEEVMESTEQLDGKTLSRREMIRISNLYAVSFSLLKNVDEKNSMNEDKMKMVLIRALQNKAIAVETSFPNWKTITKRLEKSQLYVEFVRYHRMLSDSLDSYGALVLEPGKEIETIPVCSEIELKKILLDAGASPQSAVLSGGLTRGNELLGKKTVVSGFKSGDRDQLGELLLAPLWRYISRNNTLYFVPDGLLNRLSFAALSLQNKYLVNYIRLKQVINCTSLLEVETPLPINGKAFIAGAVDYGVPVNHEAIKSRFTAALQWNYLPGTNEEVDLLDTLFKHNGFNTHVLKNTAFTNSSAYGIPGYDFVHLSTHGFYFNGEEAMNITSENINKETVYQNSLTRCGLVLSDANNSKIFIDGYLMGYELAYLDLRKCYLITLSACETGLGDIRNNMGVDGLSRALKMAGAKKLLISLWKVPDKPTVIFMKKFYESVFSGQKPAAALHDTQLWMIDKYPVEAWAAFTLVE